METRVELQIFLPMIVIILKISINMEYLEGMIGCSRKY